MKNMTLAHITEVCGGIYFGPEEKKTAEVTDIVTDSRKAGEGSLFVAIPGERVDGHKFIPNVASQGALAVISEQKLETPPCPYILVKDSMEAIKAMAEYYMQQLNIPVVGITGSVGKTSTKETIASVLAQKYRVLKTDANFNNELGLSLTVFRLREEDEMAVLEMGIDDFGQMHRLAKIARPETAVITNIGWCHLENLKTRDGILQAKTEIFDHLRENGHIIINGDDDKLSTVGTVHGIKPVHFGLDEKNEYYADEIESQASAAFPAGFIPRRELFCTDSDSGTPYGLQCAGRNRSRMHVRADAGADQTGNRDTAVGERKIPHHRDRKIHRCR